MPPKRRSAARVTPGRSKSRRSGRVPAFDDSEDIFEPQEPSPVLTPPVEEEPEPEPEEDPEEDEVEEEQDEDVDEEEAEDDDGAPAADSEQGVEQSTPRPSASRSTRRGGRAGKPMRGTRIEDWGTPEPTEEDEAPATSTPKPGYPRGRGRGGRSRGGFRGRLKPARGHIQAQPRPPLDKEGNQMEVENDELVLPEDEEGEKKVDLDGVLADGREYRVRTFKIHGRGDRLYMLSTEPARCTGFRDSYLFFAKHPTLYKIVIDENQKKDLIARELIPHSYKGRTIGVVTARSVFREFGCKIVVGGKKVTDDYKVAEALARGDRPGELADPTDAVPAPGRTYNRNQYVAWHGATSKAYSNDTFERLPVGGRPGAGAGLPGMGRKKAVLTETNWMLEHSRAASAFNSELVRARKMTHEGVYDAHTNLMCFPAVTQPTHVRWERVTTPPLTSASRKRKLDGLEGNEHMTNGTSHLTNGTTSSPPPKPATEAPSDHIPDSKLFRPLTDVLNRNFLITDTILETPALSVFPPPGKEDYSTNPFTSTHPGAPRLSEEDMDAMELPEECRQALREVRKEEQTWCAGWGPEVDFGGRGDLRIGVGMGV